MIPDEEIPAAVRLIPKIKVPLAQASEGGSFPAAGILYATGSAWRSAIIDLYGPRCIAPGSHQGRVEAHHIRYKSQGGQNHLGNGIPLCGDHHRAVHARTVLISRSWLAPVTIVHLAGVAHVDWDDQGQPFGRGFKGFAPLP